MNCTTKTNSLSLPTTAVIGETGTQTNSATSHKWILSAARKVEAAADVLHEHLCEQERDPASVDDFSLIELNDKVGDCFETLKPLRDFIMPNEIGGFDRMPHPSFDRLAAELFAFVGTLKGILAKAPPASGRSIIDDNIDVAKCTRVPYQCDHLRFIDAVNGGIRSACEEVKWAIREETKALFADVPTPPPPPRNGKSFANVVADLMGKQEAEAKELDREREEAEQAARDARLVSAIAELVASQTPPPDVTPDEITSARWRTITFITGTVASQVERIVGILIDKKLKTADAKLRELEPFLGKSLGDSSLQKIADLIGVKTKQAIEQTKWHKDRKTAAAIGEESDVADRCNASKKKAKTLTFKNKNNEGDFAGHETRIRTVKAKSN